MKFGDKVIIYKSFVFDIYFFVVFVFYFGVVFVMIFYYLLIVIMEVFIDCLEDFFVLFDDEIKKWVGEILNGIKLK